MITVTWFTLDTVTTCTLLEHSSTLAIVFSIYPFRDIVSHRYWYTDTIISHVIESLLHRYVTKLDTVIQILCTLLFLIHVPLVHGYTNSRTTVISYIVIIVTWILGTQLYHVYTSLLHMHSLFLYSCHMDHRSYCMYIHVFLLQIVSRYWYSRYWIRELLICDVWN